MLTLPLQAAPFLAAKLTLALDAAPVVTVATIGFVAAVAVVVTVVGLTFSRRFEAVEQTVKTLLMARSRRAAPIED
ncbi:MAG: hypothetical protein ACXWKO_01605 [Phenylobacterium sp.]